MLGLILLSALFAGLALAAFFMALFSDRLDRESGRTRDEHEWAADSDDAWLDSLRSGLDDIGFTYDGHCACAVCTSHRNDGRGLGGTSATWEEGS